MQDPAAAVAAVDHGLTAIVAELVSRWGVVLVAGAVVLVAYLVNRFAPQKRKRIRRTVTLFALYLITFGVSVALHVAGAGTWSERFQIASELFEAFTWVNLVALALFDLALPKASIEVVSITVDLTIGLAYIVTTIGVFSAAGMNPSSVIATSAVVSGILALSLQATLGNILGGVALQLDGSIHVGDWLQLENGRQGRVREIRWRHTLLETTSWDQIVVPNAALLAGSITILGKRHGAPAPHRMDVFFNVDFRYSPARIIEVVRDALRASPIENVAGDPAPAVICADLSKDGRDSFGVYSARYFILDMANVDSTSSVIRTRIYSALRRANVPLARPASTVFFTAEDDKAAEQREVRLRDKRLHALASLEIFRVLNETELSFLAGRLIPAPFAPGERITRQGAVAHWLYVLATGKAEIRMQLDGSTPKVTVPPPSGLRVAVSPAGQSRVIATLEGPTFFGEMGMMTGEPRSADVIALTEIECYRLDKQAFEKIIQERPEIATEMSKTLAKRRIELTTAREGLDVEQRGHRERAEAARILGRIQTFFGLERDDSPRSL